MSSQHDKETRDTSYETIQSKYLSLLRRLFPQSSKCENGIVVRKRSSWRHPFSAECVTQNCQLLWTLLSGKHKNLGHDNVDRTDLWSFYVILMILMGAFRLRIWCCKNELAIILRESWWVLSSTSGIRSLNLMMESRHPRFFPTNPPWEGIPKASHAHSPDSGLLGGADLRFGLFGVWGPW